VQADLWPFRSARQAASNHCFQVQGKQRYDRGVLPDGTCLQISVSLKIIMQYGCKLYNMVVYITVM